MLEFETCRLLTTQQVADLLGLSIKTIYNYRCQGKGPKSVRIEGVVRYRWDDVVAYIELGRATT